MAQRRAALLESRGKLLVFGGEAAASNAAALVPSGQSSSCLNDTWLVDVETSAAEPVIVERGLPPTPRMHITCTCVSTAAADAEPAGTSVFVLGGVRGGSIPK